MLQLQSCAPSHPSLSSSLAAPCRVSLPASAAIAGISTSPACTPRRPAPNTSLIAIILPNKNETATRDRGGGGATASHCRAKRGARGLRGLRQECPRAKPLHFRQDDLPPPGKGCRPSGGAAAAGGGLAQRQGRASKGCPEPGKPTGLGRRQSQRERRI